MGSQEKKRKTKEEVKEKQDKARESRDEAIQATVDKAAAEGKKVEKGKETYKTEKAKNDRDKAAITDRSSCVITVWAGKDHEKKPKKGLVERISGEKKPKTEEELQEKQDKARASRDEAIQATVDKAAAESIKVEKGKETYKTEKAKNDRERTEKTKDASIVINVLTDKDHEKKPKKGLIERLSQEKKRKT